VTDPTATATILPPPTAAAVRVQQLTKRYGSLRANDEVTFDVPKGSVFGLVGPNGAGKTTTLTVIATLLLPTSGTAQVAGHDARTDVRAVRRVLGYMPDSLGVYDNLQVGEYLRFFADAYRIPRARWDELVGGLLELVDLTVKRDAMVNSLSRGMKQRLSLARAMVHDPEVLVLDEPASGLDPRARIELRDLILQLQSMGKTVIVSSHILPELQEICSHVAIMEAGKLLASGTPNEIVSGLNSGRRVMVRYVDGTTEEFVATDHTDQAALLRRLVTEGKDIIEFIERSSGLEDLFMQITQGVVQ
jgi:ABC-2 type transport system ATP-binding protein